MKKNIFILFFLGIISFASCSFTDKKFEYTGDKEKLLMEIIQYMVSRGHYDPQPLQAPHHPRGASRLTRDRKLQCKYTTKQGTEYGYR